MTDEKKEEDENGFATGRGLGYAPDDPAYAPAEDDPEVRRREWSEHEKTREELRETREELQETREEREETREELRDHRGGESSEGHDDGFDVEHSS